MVQVLPDVLLILSVQQQKRSVNAGRQESNSGLLIGEGGGFQIERSGGSTATHDGARSSCAILSLSHLHALILPRGRANRYYLTQLPSDVCVVDGGSKKLCIA